MDSVVNLDDDSDAEPFVNWRTGIAYAAALRTPPESEQQGEGRNPSASAGDNVSAATTIRRRLDTSSTIDETTKKSGKGACVASASAPAPATIPVVYLSDSDGTPIRPSLNFKAAAAQQAANGTKAYAVTDTAAPSGKQFSDVVNLLSDDSDNDVSLNSALETCEKLAGARASILRGENGSEAGELTLNRGDVQAVARQVNETSSAYEDGNNLEDAGPSRKRNPTSKKHSLSQEERELRDAEKQRERDLKKCRQENEKRKREEEKEERKRQKEAAKLEATERRRIEKEQDKWARGKIALEHTTVQLDAKLVEMKNLGSLILHQLAEKKCSYTVASNPVERTILWTMKRPSSDSERELEVPDSQRDSLTDSQLSNSQLVLEEVEVKYVAVVLQGEEFSSEVAEGRVHGHLSRVRNNHPNHSICYIINGLTKYLKQKDQQQYKRGDTGWRRPNVELVLAEFATHQRDVQTRLCIDESEVADHIVGLTRGHAEAPFKQKLTSITVHSNGDHVTKNDPNKAIIKKSTWLKMLIAIPNITGAIAIAVAKEYTSMRALLDVYLDPSRSDHDKAVLLQNIVKEIPLGSSSTEGRRVGPVASRRIYRVLTAKDGKLRIDDVEEGADYFTGSHAPHD